MSLPRFYSAGLAEYNDTTFSINSSNKATDLPDRSLPNIKKQDFIANFWQVLPNFESIEKDIGVIDEELNDFNKTQQKIGEYEFLFLLKQKLNDILDNMNTIVTERNNGRDEIEKACDSIQKQIIFF
jgi:hypothetical protein